MKSYDEAVKERLSAIQSSKRATILAIESSCDETAAAVVRNGREVLSSIVYSQIPIHQKYGGVVPEIASRNHVGQLPKTVDAALSSAGASLCDIDAIATTSSPGLVGALLTGVSYAKGLSFAKELPLIGVNHIMGHVASNYISHKELAPPFVCLVASGGHSHVFFIKSYEECHLLSRTRDDAAGEAFDKIARVLDLPYPGGPALETLAQSGDPHAFTFPSGFNASANLDFSFSGLKTAVINLLHKAKQKGELISHADVAASFQRTVVQTLSDKTLAAARSVGAHTLALAGGVCANRALDTHMRQCAQENNMRYFSPAPMYCGDNAAMIGCAGYYALCAGQHSPLSLNAQARAVFS